MSQLSENFTVILDDVNRSGEQEIIKRWKTLLNLEFEWVEGDVAIAVSHRLDALSN